MAESIKKNYIYSISYQILAIIVPIITAPYLTRTMGADSLGVYAYTFSIAQYFFMFAMLGINNYGNRTIASVRDDKTLKDRNFSEILLMQILLGATVIVVYLCYLLVNAKYGGGNKTIYLAIWGFHILSGIIDISWFFWGIEKFKITVVRNCIVKILTTIGIFTIIKGPDDLWLYILLVAGGAFLSQIYLWFSLRGEVSFVKVKISDCKKHIVPNLQLFIPVIAVSVYTIMDKLLLGYLGSMEQLGYFDNVQKIMTLPTGLITALGAVMLPRMSNLMAKKDNDSVFRYLKVNMQFTNLFSVAFSLGLMSIGPVFATVYFGEDFSVCGYMMSYMSITIMIIAWANVIRTQYLVPGHKDRIYIISAITGAAVNIFSNLLLIPRFEAYGAITASLLAEISVAVVLTFAVRNELPIFTYAKEGLLFFFPGVLMAAIVLMLGHLMGPNLLTLLIQLFVGGLVYMAISVLIIKREHLIIYTSLQEAISKIVKR